MLGEKKFLNSIYYENLTGKPEEKKIGKCNNGKIEFEAIKMNNLPVREHYGDEAFITKPLEKDGITCCAGTVGKIENNCFIPNDNFRLKYDELSTKTGYVMVDGSTLRIGTCGNIEYKSPEYFLECPKTSYVSGSNLLIIEKKEKENVKKVLEEIEHEIQENNKKNIVLRNRTLSVEKSIIKSLFEKFESKTINSVLLIIHKDKFPLIKFNYTMPSNDKYFLYKEDVKNLEIYITNETIIKEKISQNAYTDLLMRLNKNKVLYTKCLNKDFSELYKKKLPDMVTGLKVIYDGKEITQETRNTIGNVGAFQCRPYLFLNKGYTGKYKFPFTNKDKKAVFTKRRIIDYARAETKTMKGVLIFSGTGVHFENGNRYDTAPLLIESKEKELLNISEFINKEINDEKYYACKFNNGNGFIKGKDLKVRLEIEKTDSLIGSPIDQNTFLGYRRKDKPYLDWSTFFYDNLLEIKPEKIQLVIPGGAPCVKIEKRQKKLFLSNNTCIKTSKVGTEIKSFIYGTVLAYGTFGSYGRTIFIRNRESTGIYLLAHLQGYNKPVLDKGIITPGTLVGYVGTSGPEKDGTIDGKYDAHLHVTYFSLAQSEYVKQFITGINGKNLYTDINYKNGSVRNPFNIESRKTKNKPK